MKSWRENPEGEENAKATRENSAYIAGLKAKHPPRKDLIPHIDADGMFHCCCGAQHERGPINGDNNYRCLACGSHHEIKPEAKP